MSENLDLHKATQLVHSTLQEMARYTLNLGTALQQAAPPDVQGLPKSVCYLFEVGAYFKKQCEALDQDKLL